MRRMIERKESHEVALLSAPALSLPPSVHLSSWCVYLSVCPKLGCSPKPGVKPLSYAPTGLDLVTHVTVCVQAVGLRLCPEWLPVPYQGLSPSVMLAYLPQPAPFPVLNAFPKPLLQPSIGALTSVWDQRDWSLNTDPITYQLGEFRQLMILSEPQCSYVQNGDNICVLNICEIIHIKNIIT